MAARFENPLVFTDIQDLLAAILNVIVVIAIPIVVYFLIYAGFLYVVARGNPEKVQRASRALLYGVIGGVIILGAFAITEIIGAIVGAF